MLIAMQESYFTERYAYHEGDFDSAYADLIEEAGDDVVKESRAKGWAKRLGKLDIRAEKIEQLRRFSDGEEITGGMISEKHFDSQSRQGFRQKITDEFLIMAHDVLSDHHHETYSPKVRLGAAPKIAEIVGIPELLRAGKTGPQQAHQGVKPLANEFGMLTDRQVMALYVQDNGNVEVLTNTLKVIDPSLEHLTKETVAGKLAYWQQRGVVMDEQGTVMEWDQALETMQMALKSLPES